MALYSEVEFEIADFRTAGRLGNMEPERRTGEAEMVGDNYRAAVEPKHDTWIHWGPVENLHSAAWVGFS